MNDVHLGDVDLNLLVVLDVLLEERNVTRAADRLNVTPSAVSHALRRLRNLFDDELLLRDGRRMRPTVRAEAVAETLPRLLQQVARTIAAPEPFQPGTATRTFRLAAPDFIAPVLPSLLHEVQATAPRVRVELAPYSASAVRELSDGRHDALIAPDGVGTEDLRGQHLGTWPWAVYGRDGHPAFADWSPRAWLGYPHLRVQASGAREGSPIDQRASQLGLRRVVGAKVPHFAMAAQILAQTDLLLTVPSVAMGSTARAFHLEHRELPFDVPDMGLSLFCSAAAGSEPGVRWFLDRVAGAFSVKGPYS